MQTGTLLGCGATGLLWAGSRWGYVLLGVELVACGYLWRLLRETRGLRDQLARVEAIVAQIEGTR
jgi:hypothetical protein